MIRKTIILLAAIMVGILSAHGDTVTDAAKAYGDGDFVKTIELYQKLEKQHGTSSELLFDMGQAYTRAGDMGRGMLCYQRALRLNPSNSEARANIRYIESKVADGNNAELKGKKLQVVPDEPSFFSSIKDYITKRHASDTWAFWAGLCFVLFCVCVALYIFTTRVLLRKIGFFGGGATIALSVLFLIFAFVSAKASMRHDQGVVVSYKMELRSDPSTSSKAVTTPLVQGTVMQILDTETGKDGKPEWYKVRLNSDFVGWIRNDSFEPI